MTHDQIRQRVLDRDWTLADLREAAALLGHLEGCETCRSAVQDYDALRAALGEATDSTERDRVDEDEDGDERTEPDGGWLAFEARLLGASGGRRSGFWRAWAGGLAAAAILALAVTGGWAGGWIARGTAGPPAPAGGAGAVAARQAPPGDRARPPSHRASAHVTPALLPDNVETQVSVFRRLDQVFDGRASWVAMSDSESDIGIAPAPAAAMHDDRLMLLRLTVTRGDTTVSQADLVILPDQTADLRLPFENGRTLHYQLGVSAEHPPRLTLRARLEAEGEPHTPLAALATPLQIRNRQVVTAGQVVTASGDYQLTVGFAEVGAP